MAAEQQVDVEGSYNEIITSGGDLVQGDLIQGDIIQGDKFEIAIQEETDFFEPNLDLFKPPKFISPNITEYLIETIRRNRLLVLGGYAGIDKPALARNIAWYLSEVQKPDFEEDKVTILEWNRNSSDIPNIEIKLQETISPTIFILPRILPQDVRYDLSSIKKAAEKNLHFVLISTDSPYPSWRLPKDDQHFWQELPEDLYSPNDLANVLIRELIDAQESLPEGFLGSLEPDQPLVDGILIRQVAEKLKTPDNVSRFVTLLCAEKKLLQRSVIMSLITDSTDKRRTLERWYPSLTSREQLLALGLCFFDGFFDDQFFAAMDTVVEKVWQRRESSLRALDYCDLNELRNFFDLVPTEFYGAKIESRIPGQRRMIFELAWDSHRRQILMALPVIVQLVVNSVTSTASSRNPELYGTSARRDQLRMVISEAISDIGLISENAIQRTLVQLAAYNNLGVQAVAARAMARWRDYERDKDLFKILNIWLKNPRDYMRATAALTISYAARYDPPNELNSELCNMFGAFAKDQSPLVRNRFCSHVLPNIGPRHIRQLREILQDMTQYIDLIPEIAKSLALAYRYNKEDVNEALEIWHKKYVALRPSLPSYNISEVTSREKLMATVALTYGYIKYDEVSEAEEAFKRLQDILSEKAHPFVHKNVVIAISRQASNNFEKIEPLLQNLVAKVTDSDSDEIIQILKDIYLEQRRELTGGSSFIEINAQEYPIWVDSKRPMTAVEKAMYRWIKSSNNPAAQQIAVKALVAFANAIELKEEKQILDIQELQKQLIAKTQTTPIPQLESLTLTSQTRRILESKLWEKIAIWLATIKNEQYNAILQGLLPEVLAQTKSNAQAMTYVLVKWHQADDNEIRTIAKLQDRATWFVEHNILIGVPVLGVLFLLLVGGITNALLILILLGLVILAWFKINSSSTEKQEGITGVSLKVLKEIELQLKGKLNR